MHPVRTPQNAILFGDRSEKDLKVVVPFKGAIQIEYGTPIIQKSQLSIKGRR